MVLAVPHLIFGLRNNIVVNRDNHHWYTISKLYVKEAFIQDKIVQVAINQDRNGLVSVMQPDSQFRKFFIREIIQSSEPREFDSNVYKTILQSHHKVESGLLKWVSAFRQFMH
jgi:hypothetical protein